jgi:hypothetical protein
MGVLKNWIVRHSYGRNDAISVRLSLFLFFVQGHPMLKNFVAVCAFLLRHPPSPARLAMP